MPALREWYLIYLSTLIVQMSQTAACISRHRLNERCADRLLAGCDRIESRAVPLTTQCSREYWVCAARGSRLPSAHYRMPDSSGVAEAISRCWTMLASNRW